MSKKATYNFSVIASSPSVQIHKMCKKLFGSSCFCIPSVVA